MTDLTTTTALAATLAAVLADWLGDARHEAEQASARKDAEAVRYAAERVRTLGRSRAALDAHGAALITPDDSGDLIVAGNGGDYRVSRAGLRLACTCRHGRQLALAEAGVIDPVTEQPYLPPRGTCYHVTLAEAWAEALLRQADASTARAERSAALPFEPVPPFGVSDDEVLASYFDVPEPYGGDWTEAELAAWHDEVFGRRKAA